MRQAEKYLKFKKCSKCKRYKLRIKFSRDSTAKDKSFRWCKKCAYTNQLEYRKKFPQSRRKEYLKNKEKLLKYSKNWAKNNRNWINNYFRTRYKTDIMYKLKINMRNRFLEVLKKNKFTKRKTITSAIGCSIPELKLYLESQFKPGMSWKNHGKWHIDHIKPLALAKTENQLKKLFYYKNLQPLWASDNLKKKDKWLPNKKRKTQ